MNHSDLRGHQQQKKKPTRRRRGIISLLVLVGIFFVGVLADSLVAARVEHKISQQIYAESHLPNPPDVHLAGFPYLWAAISHEMQAVTVNAKDLNVPGFGLVTVYTSAQYLTVPPSEVFNGDIEDAPARKVFTRLQLDGVSIGNHMKIDDLHIQNLEDISPRGGWETEAIFEGTPAGYERPVSVEMSLRISNGDVFLTPTRVIKAPEDGSRTARIVDGDEISSDAQQEILSAMSLQLSSDELPLNRPPVRVYVSGGSVYVEAEQFYTTVSTTDLTPEVQPLPEDEKPGL